MSFANKEAEKKSEECMKLDKAIFFLEVLVTSSDADPCAASPGRGGHDR